MTSSSFYEVGSYEEAKSYVLEWLLDRSSQKMYVEAWKGVGATALLREVAEEVESMKMETIFDTVIKVVRPAPFQNRREIQRAVAKQLNLLTPSVTDIFDKQDKEDDFGRWWEFSSRDVVSEVAEQIHQAVRDRKVLLVFCNNIAGGGLIDPDKLSIPSAFWRNSNAALWTSGVNISSEAASASADLRVRIEPFNKASALDLVYKEAAEIARYIEESSGGSLRTTPQLVVRCFWYCLLLCRAFNRSELLDYWPLEAVVKYIVCEGILQGDAAWEIGRALAPLVGPIIKYQLQYWQESFPTWTSNDSLNLQFYWGKIFSTSTLSVSELLPPKTLLIDSITQEDWVKLSSSSEEESYRWISVCSPQNNNPEPSDFSKVYDSSDMSKVSSFFGHFEKTQEVDLPDGFFDRFSNIRVLDLLGCIVSPINSSFLRLRNLRMLRLEQCSVDPSSLSSAQEEKRGQQAIFFDSLWVLNLYNSDADTFLLAGKAFELMPNLRVLRLTEQINTEFLPRSLSMAINLKELILTDCKGLQYLNFNLPATIETISLQSCPSLEEVELVDPSTAAPLPNLKSFHLSNSELITKLSLQGCRKLENVDLQELTGLKVLNLSCTAIKVVDITELPQLKQLLLLGCVLLHVVVGLDKEPKLDVLYLDNYNSNSACDVDHCLDSFRNQSLPDLTKGTNDADQRLFQAHVVVRDVRIFRTIDDAFLDLRRVKTFFHIHIKGSSPIERGFNIGTITKSNATITSALCYADVLNTMTDRHRRHHPSPPTLPLNYHIEVDGGDNSRIVEEYEFTKIMKFANSLFVHDNTSNFAIYVEFKDLKCLCIERCPNLEFIFYSGDKPFPLVELESIWLSQLPRLKALRKEGSIRTVQLKHIYLEFCAMLEYVLSSLSKLHNLETINIRYCNDLTTIFNGEGDGEGSDDDNDNDDDDNEDDDNDDDDNEDDDDDNEDDDDNDYDKIKDKSGAAPMLEGDDDNDYDKIKDRSGAAPMLLPKLRSIHLQELPKLQHIYKLNICAPSLEELKIRGCFNLRKLPLFGTSDADSMRAVKISCEKDWWDKLQWDGLESNHHASLFNPKHCPYYKKPMKARWL